MTYTEVEIEHADVRGAPSALTRMADDHTRHSLLPLLGSLQLLDSFFPSGLYTLSYGLEAFVAAGAVSDTSLAALLTDYLWYGVGPADGVALACAHRAHAASDLNLAATADHRLSAVKLAREARETSTRTGRQLVSLTSQLFDDALLTDYAARVKRGDMPSNHAVVLGLALASQGIGRVEAVAGELYAFCVGYAGAAVRLAVIDHRRAQHLLHGIKPIIVEVAHAMAEKGVREIGGCLPLVDIMAAHHERAEVRLFMS
jgi:urease accessory protein